MDEEFIQTEALYNGDVDVFRHSPIVVPGAPPQCVPIGGSFTLSATIRDVLGKIECSVIALDHMSWVMATTRLVLIARERAAHPERTADLTDNIPPDGGDDEDEDDEDEGGADEYDEEDQIDENFVDDPDTWANF